MIKTGVKLGDRSYPIYIAKDFSEIEKSLACAGIKGKVLIVADSNVAPIYAGMLEAAISGAGLIVDTFVFSAGEASKTLDNLREIYMKMCGMKLERDSTIVALGGGVTGDLAGFAAATYLRGINLVQIPTTMLAQADSSVGGKTAVDFEGKKNIIGAFYQPIFVYINVGTLQTLPERELKAGLAEVIKHGVIADADFFTYLEENIDSLLRLEINALQYVAKMNCTIKGKIVEKDERESGLRAILNFGHTIGHAVESVSEFKLLHGECVSVGIAGACKIAVILGMMDAPDAERVCELLVKAGLPVKVSGIKLDEVLEAMYFDKKIKDGKLSFVIPKCIGEVVQLKIEDEKLLKDVLSKLFN